MPYLLKEDYEYPLPRMYPVRQIFSRDQLEDVQAAVQKELRRPEIERKIFPGAKVAVAVGSRGIRNQGVIVETVLAFLKSKGASPFLVSAMGSHGSGTERGQREVLAGYGFTEEKLGVPVVTKVDSDRIGTVLGNVPVYFDRAAAGADLIIPINRVKLHTDFNGELQSGICKMLVIGLGNQIGCSSIHEEPPVRFGAIIEAAARLILEKMPVAFGLAILENAYDQTKQIRALPRESLVEEEKEMVRLCVESMPSLKLSKIDVLVMEEIGKEVSGAGFDPNVVGRSSCRDAYVIHHPEIQTMICLDVTRASHGNAIGIGLFDVITKKCFGKMDLEATYANSIACKCIEDCKIPCMVDTEEEAVRVALKICRNVDRTSPRIVKIKNTLDLERIQVSEALLEEVERTPGMERM